MVKNCQKFGYSALVAKNLLTIIFMTSNRNFHKETNLTYFIKVVVFHHVGLSWMTQMKEQHIFALDKHNE